MSVQRYDLWESDFGDGSAIVESHEGDYVLFDDYQELQDDMSDLQLKYDNLVKAIGELYRDA